MNHARLHSAICAGWNGQGGACTHARSSSSHAADQHWRRTVHRPYAPGSSWHSDGWAFRAGVAPFGRHILRMVQHHDAAAELDTLPGTKTDREAPELHTRTPELEVKGAELDGSAFGADGLTFEDTEEVDPIDVNDSFAVGPWYRLVQGKGTTSRLICRHHLAGKVLRTISDFVAPRNRA